MKGQIWGLVSDAGLPCIADPGAPLVQLARVEPWMPHRVERLLELLELHLGEIVREFAGHDAAPESFIVLRSSSPCFRLGGPAGPIGVRLLRDCGGA